ncbi:PTS system phosphoenolpyruvate-protein phosphotransferase [Klebsiella pneumoniae]|uniref:PTS system phosphoenolpyruvate-protein phosphotransferase n=1 Tax=Klebsiella pneumoniae TaxID=573 RepID=A0A378AF26_KLEPN|nr:PTS system phosphoenolpyruvate-protein phosphotransferase [Klebsiella pneumoniae]
MALVIEFTCDLPNGVHARPASLVETLCNRFSSAIEWRNLRRGTGGNAKSALAIIGSNTLKGDACQLLISGEDEAEAFAAITAFMRDEFPHCDAPLPAAPTLDVQPVPESLSRLNPTLFHAHPVCPAARRDAGFISNHADSARAGRTARRRQSRTGAAALDNGLRLLVKDIELRLLDNDGTASAILEAHRSLATGCLAAPAPAWWHPHRPQLRPAIVATGDHFCAQFRDSGNSYLQERVLDVRDVCFHCYSISTAKLVSRRRASCGKRPFCLADELTPSQFLELDKTHLKGLLLRSGGHHLAYRDSGTLIQYPYSGGRGFSRAAAVGGYAGAD